MLPLEYRNPLTNCLKTFFSQLSGMIHVVLKWFDSILLSLLVEEAFPSSTLFRLDKNASRHASAGSPLFGVIRYNSPAPKNARLAASSRLSSKLSSTSVLYAEHRNNLFQFFRLTLLFPLTVFLVVFASSGCLPAVLVLVNCSRSAPTSVDIRWPNSNRSIQVFRRLPCVLRCVSVLILVFLLSLPRSDFT